MQSLTNPFVECHTIFKCELSPFVELLAADKTGAITYCSRFYRNA
jgi:hypothetical protein